MFEVMQVVVPVIAVSVMIFTFVMMFSSKARGKWMSKQFKSMRYMMEESKDDLAKLSNTVISTKKEILDSNEDVLTQMANKEAKIKSGAIKTTVKAIKDGLTEDKKYCKHCGELIDSDSKYCSNCGKKL